MLLPRQQLRPILRLAEDGVKLQPNHLKLQVVVGVNNKPLKQRTQKALTEVATEAEEVIEKMVVATEAEEVIERAIEVVEVIERTAVVIEVVEVIEKIIGVVVVDEETQEIHEEVVTNNEVEEEDSITTPTPTTPTRKSNQTMEFL